MKKYLFLLYIWSLTGYMASSQIKPVITPIIPPLNICNVFDTSLFGLRTPFGSGSRTLEICINKCSFSPADLNVIVFYSKTESQLTSVSVNPAAAYGHGKARYIGTVGNIFRYEYTFPHD